jgi:GT2 family glycosyltransferase
MQHPLVYVIVLNWDGREHLEACFSSLLKLNYPNFRLVMVDNGSKDDSVPYVKQNFPTVYVIQLKKNYGFAAGNNVGMKYALSMGADYIFLLNNDIEAHPDCVTELVNVAENDRSIAVCASKMLYFNNRDFINGVGVCLNTYLIGWDQFNGRLNDPSLDVKTECIAACGGAFFVRTDALKRVGLFDPRYFIYFEDVDLCIRLWRIGLKIVTAPKAIIYHKFSATMVEGSQWKNYLIFRNRIYFMLKFYPYQKLAHILPRMIRNELRYCRSAREYLLKLNAILIILARLPSLLLYRLSKGTQLTKPLWDMLWPISLPPPVKQVHFPKDPSKLKTIPNRLFMGVNDHSLGQGWYGLDTDGGFKYRWMAANAKVRLSVSKKGPQVLQIAMSSPFNCYADGPLSVKISCGSKILALFNPKPEWCGYHFPIEVEESVFDIDIFSNQTIRAELTQLYGDFSVRVSEFSVLPKDSPFLRSSVTLMAEKMAHIIVIGDQEIGLGHGWDFYDPASSVRWIAEEGSAYLMPKDPGSCSKLILEACSPNNDGANKLEVEVNGEVVGEFHLEKKWNEYHTAIPRYSPLLEIKLRTDKILPRSEVGYSKRRLGIMLRRISIA